MVPGNCGGVASHHFALALPRLSRHGLHGVASHNLAVPVCRCASAPLCLCASVRLCLCAVVLLRLCTVVPLSLCVAVPLFFCASVPLCRCVFVFLCLCASVPLASVPLCLCPCVLFKLRACCFCCSLLSFCWYDNASLHYAWESRAGDMVDGPQLSFTALREMASSDFIATLLGGTRMV